MTEKQLLELLVEKVTGIETKLTEHDRRFEAIEAKLSEHDRRFEAIDAKLSEHDRRFEAIETKLTEHDRRFESIEKRLDKLESTQMAIMEQVAGLLEFRTHVLTVLQQIVENQKSLAHMFGEHEMYIRNLQRKVV